MRTRIALNANGRWLAVSRDEWLDVWDLKTGKRIHRFPQKNQNYVMAFGLKGNLLISPDAEQSLRSETSTPESGQKFFPGCDLPVESLAFSPDGKRLAVGIRDKSIRIFDLTTKNSIQKFTWHGDQVTHLLFDAAENGCFPGQKLPRCFCGISKRGSKCSRKRPFARAFRNCFYRRTENRGGAESPRRVLSVSDHGKARDAVHASSRRSTVAKNFAYHKQNQMLAVAYDTGIHIRDQRTGIPHPFIPEDKMGFVEWGPEGRILVGASLDLFGWDTEEQREVYRISKDRLNGPIMSMARSPDGQIIATGIFNQSVKLWAPQTGRLIHEIPSPGRSLIETLKFSPDGRLLFAMARDMYFVIEAKTGLIWYQQPIPLGTEKSFAIMGPHTLLSAESQGTARLWSWAPAGQDKISLPPEKLWEGLSSGEGATVYQAMFGLTNLKDDAVEFLEKQRRKIRLPTAPPKKWRTDQRFGKSFPRGSKAGFGDTSRLGKPSPSATGKCPQE